jgi:hypothetical protein
VQLHGRGLCDNSIQRFRNLDEYLFSAGQHWPEHTILRRPQSDTTTHDRSPAVIHAKLDCPSELCDKCEKRIAAFDDRFIDFRITDFSCSK